ncbi:MAG: cobalamin-independent methionine synthase II family protein [Hyphomicrobiales bacterium]|nr:cobalamin-independent methionine synthase II family protein [Hyphomicrobiales bacterium]
MTDLRRIRVDQVGSLCAPLALQEVFGRYKRGEASNDELKTAQDKAITAIVTKQTDLGLPVVTDGELRRRNFQESFALSVRGFDQAAEDKSMASVTTAPMARAEQDFSAPGPAIVTRRKAVERLRLVRNVPLDEYRIASKLTKTPVKVSVLSPDRISQRFDWENSTAVYRDMDAFMADVVEITRRMIRELVEAGCSYIQIDAPGYTAYADEVSLERMRARGEDPNRNLERSIAADNAVIDGFPGVTFGIHFCKGNARTIDPVSGKVVPQWHREGNYDAIAERVFSQLKHHRFLLEYDDERSGGFEPLRHIAKGAVAVVGLVSTKREDVEPFDLLKKRLDEAAKHLPLDRLAISPQCGFGGLDHIVIPESEQWRKFERMIEVAKDAWGSVV